MMRFQLISLLVTILLSNQVRSNIFIDIPFNKFQFDPENIDHASSFDLINGGLEEKIDKVDLEVLPFIKEIGENTIDSNSKIDLGVHGGISGYSQELISVSKDLSELNEKSNQQIKDDTDPITNEEVNRIIDENPSPTEVQESLEKNTKSPQSSETSTTDLPSSLSTLHSIEEVTKTVTTDVAPAPRPIKSNRIIITRTTTKTHTVATSTPLVEDYHTTIIEVTETYFPSTPTPTSTSTAIADNVSSPISVPVTEGPIVAQPLVAPTTETTDILPPAPAFPTLPHTEPHNPTPYIPTPHPTPNLSEPTQPYVQDSSNMPSQDAIFHMEQSIKQSIEKYLKERLDSLLPNFDRSPQSEIPLEMQTTPVLAIITSTSTTDPILLEPTETPQGGDEVVDSIISDIEGSLKSGFEDLNVERLKSVLKAVLNPKLDSSDKDAGSIKEKETDNLKKISELKEELLNTEEDDKKDTDSIKSHLTSSEAKEELKSLRSLINILNTFTDKFDTQGLSEKDMKKFKKAQYHLGKLKDIPEDVLKIVFADDKKKSWDDLLHRPFSKQIGLDMTNLELDGGSEVVDEEFEEDSDELKSFDNIQQEQEADLDSDSTHINNRKKSFRQRHKNKERKKTNKSSTENLQNDGLDQVVSEKNFVFGDSKALEEERFNKDDQHYSFERIKTGDNHEETADPSEIQRQHSNLNNASKIQNITTYLPSTRGPKTNAQVTDEQRKPANIDYKTKDSSESFLDKFKKNPSLLFTGGEHSQGKDKHYHDNNDLFDFTRSNDAVTHRLSTAMGLFVSSTLLSLVLV